MIWNVIDRRTRPYRWKRINVVIEAIDHDNNCLDADQVNETLSSCTIDYDRRENISILEAIEWASRQRCPVTLFIYDCDDGLMDRSQPGARPPL